MASRPNIGGKTCVSCAVTGPILLPDGVCAACQSATAWADYAHTPLVIGHAEAERATPVAEVRPPRTPWIAHYLAALLISGALVVAIFASLDALAPIEIGALLSITDSIQASASHALWMGLLSVILGAGAVIALRRSQHVRSAMILSVYCMAIVVGITTATIGYVQGLGAKSDHIAYKTMPAVSQLNGYGMSPAVGRIAESTVVVVAPDKDGDARYAALGTGTVIANQSDRVWVISCSHVAIPYVSTGSVRDPAKTFPVWIEFSDGRGAKGDIVWAAPPPLDVVVISVALDNPPPPVEISPSTALLDDGSAVVFVPNPLLHGWQVHHGAVTSRLSHDTPAGEYALVFTTLPVQPGDSGSGLFDEQGRLVGLNTWASFDSRGWQGISLPSEVLRSLEGAIETGNLSSLDSIVLSSESTRN